MGCCRLSVDVCSDGVDAVSYTHLDVYKIQLYGRRACGAFALAGAAVGQHGGAAGEMCIRDRYGGLHRGFSAGQERGEQSD